MQCDTGYYLYTGKCYDPIRYRALLKIKSMAVAAQIGSNSVGSLKVSMWMLFLCLYILIIIVFINL